MAARAAAGSPPAPAPPPPISPRAAATAVPSPITSRPCSRRRRCAACSGSTPWCCTPPTKSTPPPWTPTWPASKRSCARWPARPCWSAEARMESSLLVDAVVYLAAAVLAVPIAKRFGLGAVLGYLIAGIAIGPWGLGLITDVQDILHFSEFGVVLLLFMIGLELEPKRLWAMRRPIFGGGSAQVAAVTVVLAGAALLLGVDWKTALIAALGLSLSSTAIALATLEERNLTSTPTGSAAFSILLFQDVAAIPMIALVPVLGAVAAEGNEQGLIKGVRVAAVLIGLVLAGRYLDGAGRLHGRGAAGRFRIPPRPRIGPGAVQGPAAWPVLHGGGHVGGLRRAARPARVDPVAGGPVPGFKNRGALPAQ